jgi:hypothetical protein
VFTGMIKPDEDDPDSILFARPGDCSSWITISADDVEDIKLLHIVRCAGHTHPLVHLFMKEPEGPRAKSFAELARLHSAPLHPAAASPVATHPLAMAAGPTHPPGWTPCHWDWGLNQWVCPPA